MTRPTRTRERRGAPRAAADAPLQLTATGAAEPARLKNISRTGLCCEVGEEIPEMTRMGIDVQLPDSTACHRIEGVVVRSEKVPEKNPRTWEVAIFFTGIDADARGAIDRYVAGRSLRRSL